MEMDGLAGDGRRGHKGSRPTRGVKKGELREEGDGLRMGVDGRGSSASEESKRCMTVCILGSILTLTMGGVFKVEKKWERVRISVDTLEQKSRSP